LVYSIAALICFSDNDPPVYSYLLVLVPACIGVFIQELYTKSETPIVNISYTFTGILYTVIPFTFFHALAYTNIFRQYNFHYPLAFLVMLWANDTGAYLSGYFFGRTKLFERHSPKKTWEGFIGGVLISVLAAYILSIFYKELTWTQWGITAVIIGCFGTMGDLVESM